MCYYYNIESLKSYFLYDVLACKYSSLDGTFSQSQIPRSSCESESSRSKLGSLSPHPQLEIPISDDTESVSTLGMRQFAFVFNPRYYNMEN